MTSKKHNNTIEIWVAEQVGEEADSATLGMHANSTASLERKRPDRSPESLGQAG